MMRNELARADIPVTKRLRAPTLAQALVVVLLATSPIRIAGANDLEPESPQGSASPKVCVGFNGSEHPQPWGEPGVANCPANYAVYSSLRAGRTIGGKRIKRVTCCPLPHDDILLDEHVHSMKECPKNSVVTGDTLVPPAECPDCDLLTRCTMINTERYQLSEASPGAHWGEGASSWKETRRILKRDVPVAIRHSLGRKSEFSWHTLGCVGFPFGALLTSSDAIECHHFMFRQLQYRGISGDPPAGTPVQMFPNCRYLSSQYEPEPECLE